MPSASILLAAAGIPLIYHTFTFHGKYPPSSCAFQVPIVALSLFASISALLTLLCDIHILADFLSIGTLIAYTIVAVNVCILRYCQPSLGSNGWSELPSTEQAVSCCLDVVLVIEWVE